MEELEDLRVEYNTKHDRLRAVKAERDVLWDKTAKSISILDELDREIEELYADMDRIGGVDPRKGERFLHDFTQTLMPHLYLASHDARNSSGGTYFSAECSLFRL